MSADQSYREQVRIEAIAAGHSPTVAAYIASQVGLDTRRVLQGEQRTKPPAAPVPLSRTARTAAPISARASTGTALDRLCSLFKADSLAAEFKRAGTPLRAVAHMLADATGNARSISAGGIGRVRLQLLRAAA